MDKNRAAVMALHLAPYRKIAGIGESRQQSLVFIVLVNKMQVGRPGGRDGIVVGAQAVITAGWPYEQGMILLTPIVDIMSP